MKTILVKIWWIIYKIFYELLLSVCFVQTIIDAMMGHTDIKYDCHIEDQYNLSYNVWIVKILHKYIW
jgi:hypothetical protein